MRPSSHNEFEMIFSIDVLGSESLEAAFLAPVDREIPKRFYFMASSVGQSVIYSFGIPQRSIRVGFDRRIKMSDIKSLSIKATLLLISAVLIVFGSVIGANAQTVDFESPTYTIGNINGQDGWSKTGPFDMMVSSSFGKTGFGSQSFRLSNAITSGSFGNMAFSKPNANEAGETSATNGGLSGGTRQNYFESQFSITTTTTSHQPGLSMSTAPDRGDGARMSYLRFEDQADGIHVFFDDFQDLAPFGTANGDDANGCNAGGDDFFEYDIATLNRTTPHLIKYVIFFNDGPRNDVVQIYIDGVLVHTGTTWEDYFRFCAEANADNNTHTVDSLLFRTAGTAHPEHSGNGFLIDNMNAAVLSSVLYVDDDGTADSSGCDVATPSLSTIPAAVAAAAPGGTIHVCPGTYVGDPVIDKPLTILGPNAAINPNTGVRLAEATILPAASAPNPAVCEVMTYVGSNNVTIKGFTFDGDNPALTSGILIGSADVDACEIIAGYDGIGNITVENNILKHSTYSGVDFYNYYNDAATSNNYIRYNRFESIGETTYNWGLGVLIYNNFYADVTDNVFASVRTGVQTGNYYRANPGTTGSISNNQIGTWRLGIFHNLAYSNASTFTLSNNTITAENHVGTTKWNGILLSSISTPVNAVLSGNTVVIPGSVTYAPPGYTAGYNVWNVNTSAPITISGGSVTGGDYGIFVNNFEGYNSNAGNTSVDISTVNIQNSAVAGVYVKDSPDNTNGATVYARVTNSSIDTNGTGVLIEGSDATAAANFNRLVGNSTIGINNGNGSFTMNAENNWWGCNYGPGATGLGCSGTTNGVSGLVDANPWLRLTTSASASPIYVGGTSNITSLLTTNSDNATPGGGSVPNSTLASFAGTFGTVSPSSTNLAAGSAATVFTATAQGVGGVATTVDSQTVSAPITVYNAACAAISTQNLTSLTGEPITMPVITDEMTGRGGTSADFTITYDPNVLTYNSASLGSVTAGNVLVIGPPVVVDPTHKRITVSISGTVDFAGSGSLVDLDFDVIGLPGTSSPVTIGGFVYNEGNPCSTVSSGTLSVISGVLSGKVTYWNEPAGPNPVPGVKMNAVGASTFFSNTIADGTYSLSGFLGGSYTVTPSKTTAHVPSTVISGVDASLIAQHVVGSSIMTNADQLAVADVSGNGSITSFDASMIARYAVLLPNTGLTGNWVFVPNDRTYSSVYVDTPNENYVARLMGDVSGNWTAALSPRPAPRPLDGEKPLTINAASVNGAPGTAVTVPVSIRDTTGRGIMSYQFDLRYDPAVLEPAANTADLAGTISDGYFATVNSTERGLLKVIAFGPNALSGAGHLLNLKFNVIGDVNETSDLTWESFNINEGGINFEVMNGRVAVRAASNDAAIAGRVLSAAGQPVGGATVTLVDTNGQTRTARTSSLGNFRFAELTVGQTYTVSVSAKRYTFASQTVSVTGDAVTLDMIAEQ